MRIVRYRYKEEPPSYGWLLEDKIGAITGSIYGDYRRQEVSLPLASVKLLAPAEPSKIVCLGRNYAEHAKEQEVETPKVP
jgi:2-keto-4-pentenoate hydratase/2-oxohepta-3-ene-1,7-dioic acid hydratase in catechol pathway